MKHRGFTLIELLVVIAIIAILAAILFPVFAQAKLAAKKTQQVSNVKQLALGVTMYANDYDDTFPAAFQPVNGSWAGDGVGNFVNWAANTQPYIKNLNIFFSPVDSAAGKPIAGQEWQGVGLSLAANGYYSPNWTNGFELLGPMGINGFQGWLGANGSSPSLVATQVSQPANSILLGEKHQDDVIRVMGTGWVTNMSNYGPGSWFSANEFGLPSNIPDGRRGVAVAWPNGASGAVSAKYAGQAAFAYVDGHVKTANPASTNPNPVTQPDLNQWNAKR